MEGAQPCPSEASGAALGPLCCEALTVASSDCPVPVYMHVLGICAGVCRLE